MNILTSGSHFFLFLNTINYTKQKPPIYLIIPLISQLVMLNRHRRRQSFVMKFRFRFLFTIASRVQQTQEMLTSQSLCRSINRLIFIITIIIA